MLVSSALSALCHRRCGFDPAGLSSAQLRERLPLIVKAVDAERRRVLGQIVEVQKSAAFVSGFNRLIPNAGITRDEYLNEIASPVETDDPNAVLNGIMPWESRI